MKIKEITFQAKPKKEAAGVGIVTKQNATKDVPVGGEYMNVKKLGLGKGKPKKIKDSVIREGEARIQHAEDLVLFDGSRGAKRALGELKQLASGGENVTNQDSVQKDMMVKRNQETMLKRCLWLDQEHRKILKDTKP